jgi:hypothetical protein
MEFHPRFRHAEGIEVPWVCPVARPNGRNKAVVEVVRLAEYLTQKAGIIAEQAGGRTSKVRIIKRNHRQSIRSVRHCRPLAPEPE